MSEMIGVQTLEERTPEAQSRAFDEVWDSPKGFLSLFRTINNMPIAKRYMGTAFVLFLLAGLMAALMRTQLIVPNNDFLDAETFNQLFTMHGTTMMFLFVIPFIEAIANYFLPLLIGTRDLPFPRLTAFAYWTYLFGAIYIFSSFLFGLAPDGGWFAYPPLTLKEFSPGLNLDFWDIGLSVAEIAAIGAAAEIIVAILRMRAPGMGLYQLPIFGWAMLITAFMIIFAFTPLVVGTAFLEFDRKGITHFFDPQGGGDPLLWQHIFWVFGHPEVYIMFIPAAGLVTHIVQVFARRPIVSYPLVVLSLLATGFISFGLWVHHMFTTGLPPVAMGFFAAASLTIAIPNGIQFFSWIATLWTGKPVWHTPLLFVVGFLVIFLIGGLTGVMVGAVPFDWQVHDSYFVVAHFHYVLIGGVLFPLFAALYYWWPKLTGRLLSERIGKWQFWLMFVFFNIAFFPMHISGLLGMPRRVYTYPAGLGWELPNLISTVGAYGFALGVLLGIFNMIRSVRFGRPAGNDPWQADTLEWSHSSPPPNAQFKYVPEVMSRHPLWDQKSLEPRDEQLAVLLQPLQSGPTRWRGAAAVSMLEARPVAIVHVPGPTIWPFVEAVGFLIIFAGLLIEHMLVIGAGALIAVVALFGWFWPAKTEDIALAEIGIDGAADKLPLGVYGRNANGWWGTWVFLLVWITALFTLIASYFYLGRGPAAEWPPIEPGLDWALVATLFALLLVPATWLFARRIEGNVGGRRIGLATSLLLNVAMIVVTIIAWRSSTIIPNDAYGSAFVFLIGFQWITNLIVIAMCGAALAWAIGKPTDPRGWGAALNASLISYYAVFNWLVILAVAFISPRLW